MRERAQSGKRKDIRYTSRARAIHELTRPQLDELHPSQPPHITTTATPTSTDSLPHPPPPEPPPAAAAAAAAAATTDFSRRWRLENQVLGRTVPGSEMVMFSPEQAPRTAGTSATISTDESACVCVCNNAGAVGVTTCPNLPLALARTPSTSSIPQHSASGAFPAVCVFLCVCSWSTRVHCRCCKRRVLLRKRETGCYSGTVVTSFSADIAA